METTARVYIDKDIKEVLESFRRKKGFTQGGLVTTAVIEYMLRNGMAMRKIDGATIWYEVDVPEIVTLDD